MLGLKEVVVVFGAADIEYMLLVSVEPSHREALSPLGSRAIPTEFGLGVVRHLVHQNLEAA